MGVDLRCSEKRGFMSTGPNSIRILTVDDHALLRQGIAALIEAQRALPVGLLNPTFYPFEVFNDQLA